MTLIKNHNKSSSNLVSFITPYLEKQQNNNHSKQLERLYLTKILVLLS